MIDLGTKLSPHTAFLLKSFVKVDTFKHFSRDDILVDRNEDKFPNNGTYPEFLSCDCSIGSVRTIRIF